MKQNVFEHFRIVKIYIKISNFLLLFGMSILWVGLAFLGYSNMLTPNILDNYALVYSANSSNLVTAFIYYLSYGVPMIFVAVLLQQSLCEEYYYSRAHNKKTVLLAKVNAILFLLMVILIIQMTGLGVLTSLIFRDNAYLSSAENFFGVFLSLFLGRSFVILILLFAKLLAADILNAFTILTGTIFGYALFQRLHAAVEEASFRPYIKNDCNFLFRKSIALLVLIMLIMLIDNKNDIAVQMDEEKNDG